jgi:hypothetical protein
VRPGENVAEVCVVHVHPLESKVSLNPQLAPARYPPPWTMSRTSPRIDPAVPSTNVHSPLSSAWL